MNKKTINQELQVAYKAIKEKGIANDNDEIQRKYRGYISSFGAAVTMGSLLQAIAFLGKDKERSKVRDAILQVLKENEKIDNEVNTLFEYAQKETEKKYAERCQEEILNATIAIKLAMNLYKWIDNKESDDEQVS